MIYLSVLGDLSECKESTSARHGQYSVCLHQGNHHPTCTYHPDTISSIFSVITRIKSTTVVESDIISKEIEMQE